MSAPATTVLPVEDDDGLTVCAISLISAMLADVLHEGLGHGVVALLTVAPSGVISTVAWTSAYDSRLVAAGGTLVNLAAAVIFWLALRGAKHASAHIRYFLLTSLAFNIFTGTGYFFFSGVTDFGDWAVVIAPIHPHWFWRTLLVVVGMGTYYTAIQLVGGGLVHYVGIRLDDTRRFRKLTLIPYFSAIVLLGAGGILNPAGIQLVWESALPASAGADSGLLWMRTYIPKGAVPESDSPAIGRNDTWIVVAMALSLAFVFALGRGVPLHR
jgi:hypothetical protein